jgi:hypothetical protein
MLATDDPGRMAASAIWCALQQAGVAPLAVVAAETAALQQVFGTRPLARLMGKTSNMPSPAMHRRARHIKRWINTGRSWIDEE